MEWLCAGAAIWVALAVIGLIALAGLILLLVKLGVIVHYATKPEPQETSDYTLADSHAPDETGGQHGA
ncbi:MAG: hypothetical protein QHH80_01380 [Anaerolineae bacterium]|nr:hypothetical protein [Anaerolineae bacterium]